MENIRCCNVEPDGIVILTDNIDKFVEELQKHSISEGDCKSFEIEQ